MAATIIDALVVELGLDPSKFTKGQEAALASFKKTQEQAKKTADDIEDRSKKAEIFVTKLRGSILTLFAAFTAGRGLKDFAENITATDAGLGRLAVTLDSNVGVLAAWRGAATLLGGTAAGVQSSIQNLVSGFEQFSITGQSSTIPYFRAMGIAMSDASGKMRPLTDIYLAMARWAETQPDKARAAEFFRGAGVTDPGMINLLLQGHDKLQSMLADQAKYAPKPEDVKAAQDLQKQFAYLELASTRLGITLLTQLAPAIKGLADALKGLGDWLQAHPRTLDIIAGGLAAIATAITVGLGASVLGTAVEGLTAFLGILTGIGAFFSASGILLNLAVLTETALPALSAAFLAVGGAIEATPLGWILTGIAALGLAAYELYEHWNDIGAWWHNLWLKMGEDTEAPFRNVHGNQGGGAPTTVNQAFGGAAYRGNVGGGYGQAQGDISKLMAMGWTRAQASGIAANIKAESSGVANLFGDNGQAYGLAQWHKDRQTAFARWAGHSILSATRDEQLGFINYELRNGSEQAAGRRLASATTAADAGAIISVLYERPADAAGSASARAAIASSLYGAKGAALAGGSSNSRVSNSTSSRETNIGTINVNAPNATDAVDISKGIGGALQQIDFGAQANYGPA